MTPLEQVMAEAMVPVPSEPAPHKPKRERRASVRFLLNHSINSPLVAASSPEEPEIGWFGHLLDISLGGVGLLLPRSFEAGCLLTLELSDPAQGKPRSFAVRVVHASPDETRGWLVGCEFLYPLHEAELQALIAE